MDEGHVFVQSLKWIVIGLVCVVVAVIGSCQASKYQLRKTIEAGADPLEAKCALEGSGDSNQAGACLLLYGRARLPKQGEQR